MAVKHACYNHMKHMYARVHMPAIAKTLEAGNHFIRQPFAVAQICDCLRRLSALSAKSISGTFSTRYKAASRIPATPACTAVIRFREAPKQRPIKGSVAGINSEPPGIFL